MSGQAGAVTERDREVEVTLEMVEAGVSVLVAADYRFETSSDVVREILEKSLRLWDLRQSSYPRLSG